MQEDAIVFNFNSHLLVTEYTRQFASGKKYIELDWDPIVFDGVIEKIMVTVRDVTQVKALQEEARAQRVDLEMNGHILNIDKDSFVNFLSCSFTFIEECRSIIMSTTVNDPEVVSHLFRNMHTVKGNARTYGLDYVTDSVHDVEQLYDELRKNPEAPWDQDRLLGSLQKAENDIKRYQEIYENKLGLRIDERPEHNSVSLVTHDIDSFLSKFEEVSSVDTTGLPSQVIECLRDSCFVIAKMGMKQLSEIVSHQVRLLASLAKELDKSVPQVVFQVDGLFIKEEAWECLQNVFTHILRNAIDHGIESSEERLSKGKRSYGRIDVGIVEFEDQLRIRIKDDGRGLPLGSLRNIARSQGLLGVDGSSNQEVANLVFNSGISSAKGATTVSGRGVGMDASRRFLEELGGSLSVQLLSMECDENKALDFFPFEIHIEIPKELYFMAPKFSRSA